MSRFIASVLERPMGAIEGLLVIVELPDGADGEQITTVHFLLLLLE